MTTKTIDSNKISDWPSKAESAAEIWQADCIDSIITDLSDEFNDANYTFEEWHIQDYLNSYIENACIYNSDCQKIIDELDYNIWEDDPMMGQRANSLMQAAYWALEGALYSIDIEEVIKNKLKQKFDI